MTRHRRRSGSYPTTPPIDFEGAPSVVAGPDRIRIRALEIVVEIEQAGSANRMAAIERGLRAAKEQIDAHLAKCTTIDVDCDEEEQTQRWRKAI